MRLWSEYPPGSSLSLHLNLELPLQVRALVGAEDAERCRDWATAAATVLRSRPSLELLSVESGVFADGDGDGDSDSDGGAPPRSAAGREEVSEEDDEAAGGRSFSWGGDIGDGDGGPASGPAPSSSSALRSLTLSACGIDDRAAAAIAAALVGRRASAAAPLGRRPDDAAALGRGPLHLLEARFARRRSSPRPYAGGQSASGCVSAARSESGRGEKSAARSSSCPPGLCATTALLTTRCCAWLLFVGRCASTAWFDDALLRAVSPSGGVASHLAGARPLH